jgi:hypothetical protein
VFYDPFAPMPGHSTNKSAYTCTVIVAANAAGELLSPHFQFSTTAKTDEGLARWCLHTARRFHKVRVQCGFDSVQELPVTFGKNEKGGMKTEEFQEYIEKNIMRLYPDACDEFGKRVLLKMDS